MASAPIHAQMMQAGRPEAAVQHFRGRQLIGATLTIKETGERFSGLVPIGTGIEDAIGMIARQNGGDIVKRYYPEMKAFEIVGIHVGNSALLKNDVSGIHWFIGKNKIPVIADKNGNIYIPNGKEIKLDEKTGEISVAMESNTLDPKNLKDLTGRDDADNILRKKIGAAHANMRENDVEIKKGRILLFDKESGELKPLSEYNGGAESFKHDDYAVRPFYLQFTDGMRQPPDFRADNCRAACGDGIYYIEILGCKARILDRIECAREAPMLAGNISEGMLMEIPRAVPLQDAKIEYAGDAAMMPCFGCGTAQPSPSLQSTTELPLEPRKEQQLPAAVPKIEYEGRGKEGPTLPEKIETKMPVKEAEGMRTDIVPDMRPRKEAGERHLFFNRSEEKNTAHTDRISPEKKKKADIRKERAEKKEKNMPVGGHRASTSVKTKSERLGRRMGRRRENGILAETIMKPQKAVKKKVEKTASDKRQDSKKTVKDEPKKTEKNKKAKTSKAKPKKEKLTDEGYVVRFNRKRLTVYHSVKKENAAPPHEKLLEKSKDKKKSSG